MAIVLACLLSAFFIMGFISVYVRQCAERRVSLTNDTDGTGSFLRSRRGVRGLDPAVVNTFPTFLYSDVKGHKIGQSALECAVCLLEFEDDEILRLLPKCSHAFHPDCIDAWLAFHFTCPVCRADLVPKPGEPSHATTLIRDPDSNVTESNAPPGNGGSAQVANELIIDIDTPELINPSQTPNQNRSPKSTPRRTRNAGKFPRSHSTGHSVVQPGDNCERFTLRLPEEVRSQLINHTFSRSTSSMAFPRARSSRKGFRSISVGTGRGKNYENYERFDREGRSGRWNLRLTPPFISRGGLARSASSGGSGGDDLMATPRSLMRSIKSPLDRLFRGTDKDDGGERSTDRLRPDGHA